MNVESRTGWGRRVWLIVVGFAIGLGLAGQWATVEGATPFADVRGHWSEETVGWGVEAGVVGGFPDGSFRPNATVTEAQFTAMLFRAFPDARPEETGPYWYTAYYRQAASWKWPVTEKHANRPVLRGKVAQIVAASQGRQLDVDDAVDFLLERSLAQGRNTANGRIDFGSGSTLTRAEAVQFVRNVATVGAEIGPADVAPAADAAATGAVVSVGGVAIGDTEEQALAALGPPARRELSEYGFEWYVYNQDYARFALVGVRDGFVVGLYGNGDNLRLRGADASASSADVRRTFGLPLESIRKDNTLYMIGGSNADGQAEYEVFETDDAYVTVFYDLHEGGVVSGAQAIEKRTEQSLHHFYGPPSERLRASYERLTLDLVNSARVSRGLNALEWDAEAAATATGHSADMAANGFFSHTNLRGEDLGDRLALDGVDYASAGENIAYGQTSAVFAHEGWMNSPGHRRNILAEYEALGVGVVFRDDRVPFYTQNFISR